MPRLRHLLPRNRPTFPPVPSGLLARTLIVLGVVWLAAPVSAQTCASLPSDMISWWPGEGNANDTKDSNHGAMQNGATFAPGKVGQAFSFDGVDDYVEIPHNANQNTGAGFTVDAWINPTTYGHGFTIAQKRSTSNQGGFALETTHAPFGNANGLQFAIWVGAGLLELLTTPPNVVSTGVWQHVAATYDGATMRVYVNGVEQASLVVAGVIEPTADPFVIGRNVVIPSFAWAGYIDEVHLFSRALSATEIQAIHAAGAAGICPGSTGASSPSPYPDVALSQNHPNPFNPGTVIDYELPAALDVRLSVYDTAGRLVRSLVDGGRPAGVNSVRWDGRDAQGTSVSTGVYFYRLQAGAAVLTRKMVLLK